MHLRGVVYRNIQHLTGDLINTLIIKIIKVWTILRKKYLKNLL